MFIKPPLGLMPRWLNDELNFDNTSSQKRLDEINAAINRYSAANKEIPREWITEKRDIENQ